MVNSLNRRAGITQAPEPGRLGGVVPVAPRYSLGTISKNLKSNPDGSLSLYVGTRSPGADKETNWVPAPEESFSLFIRAYWGKEAILDGSWTPPVIEKVK
jgi:hypothetical protein